MRPKPPEARENLQRFLGSVEFFPKAFMTTAALVGAVWGLLGRGGL